MPDGDVETFQANGRWHNRIEGHEMLEGTYGTRGRALTVGREEARAREVGHIIWNFDGTFTERHSYGHDPRTSPG